MDCGTFLSIPWQQFLQPIPQSMDSSSISASTDHGLGVPSSTGTQLMSLDCVGLESAQQSSSYSQRSARPATVVSWQREEDRKWVVVGKDRKVEMNKRKSPWRQKKFKRACFANCYANKDDYLDKKNFS